MGGRPAKVGAGHRVQAIRIELWDSNRPYVSRDHAEQSRTGIHLIYFPKSGRFSFPRNDYYELYEQHALGHYRQDRAAGRLSAADLARKVDADRANRLFQPQATFLAPGALRTTSSNTRVMRTKRAVLGMMSGEEAPMTTIRTAVRSEHERVFARSGRGVASRTEEAERFWQDPEDETDRYVDEYLLETFKVRDVESQVADESMR